MFLKNINVFKWGLGIGDWGLGPIPNPHKTIQNIFSSIFKIIIKLKL